MTDRYPTDDDLLAWNLFRMLETVPRGEVDPPLLKVLIDMHRITPRYQVHRYLHHEYEEYRQQFVQ